MEIQTFDSWEELHVAVCGDNDAADAAAAADPQTYEVGDYFLRFFPEMRLVVYGEILDPVETNRQAGGDDDECEYLRHQYALPHMQFVRYTCCYSSLVEEGELGNTHCSSMNAKISEDEFTRARKTRWPSDRTGVLAVFGITTNPFTGVITETLEA